MSYHPLLAAAAGVVGILAASASPDAEALQAPAAPAFPLKLSADRQRVVDQRDQPWMFVGDSPWSLIVEPTLEGAERYLADRQAKGFTVLLVNLIEHKFASDPPRLRNGMAPFATPDDLATVNQGYFDYAEEVIRRSAQHGLAVLLCPAYLGANGGDEGFYQEQLRSGREKVRDYGRFVGRRFRAHPNIVWVLGGDFNPPAENTWVVDELAAGILAADTNHLMTVHCGSGSAAAGLYGDRPWLQLNNVYHYREELYAACDEQDLRSPRLAYFMLESAYEGEHHSTPDRIRRQAYWPILCGAFGTLYGNSPLWHFGSRGVFDRGGDWTAALNSTGAQDMGRLARFFSQRRWWLLRPDRNHRFVTAGYGAYGKLDYVVTSLASDGSWAVSYVPSMISREKRELTVDLRQLSGPSRAGWFDPTDGRVTTIEGSPFARRDVQRFSVPGDNAAGSSDWIFVIETEASSPAGAANKSP